MTCMVHDRKTTTRKTTTTTTHIPLNQDGGSVHVVPRKLDLDQTSMDTNVIKLTFRLQISIWIILMIFVTQNRT